MSAISWYIVVEPNEQSRQKVRMCGSSKVFLTGLVCFVAVQSVGHCTEAWDPAREAQRYLEADLVIAGSLLWDTTTIVGEEWTPGPDGSKYCRVKRIHIYRMGVDTVLKGDFSDSVIVFQRPGWTEGRHWVEVSETGDSSHVVEVVMPNGGGQGIRRTGKWIVLIEAEDTANVLTVSRPYEKRYLDIYRQLSDTALGVDSARERTASMPDLPAPEGDATEKSEGAGLKDEWMPQWVVGDWWIVQSYGRYDRPSSTPLPWSKRSKRRWEVKGIEEVDGENCYVLELSDFAFGEDRLLQGYYYFRVEDLRAVKVHYPPERHALLREDEPGDRYLNVDGGYAVMTYLPCFPLVLQGPRADSLATTARKWAGIGLSTQEVTSATVNQCTEILTDLDSICTSLSQHDPRACVKDTLIMKETRKDEAYSVRVKSRMWVVEQVWVPSLPYALVTRRYWGAKEEDPNKKVLDFDLLVDCSGMHREDLGAEDQSQQN